ncbi:MAG: hypothetical protein KJ732_06895 [Candidatus Margulisbacteria bacterium]|nr:hypothetical protein [Candidatus Margulisiibacteriota bacterium]
MGTKIIIMFISLFLFMSFTSANADHEEAASLLSKADNFKYAEKYEEAEKLYDEVLKIDPNNKEALQGKDDCRIMIEPIIPTQHLMIPPAYDDPEYNKLIEQFEQAKTPWEKRRLEIALDRFALKYTGRVYSADVPRWEEKAEKVIARAISKVKVGLPPEYVYQQTKRDLESLQETANRGWKGHGPEILEPALLKLKKLYQENSYPFLD